MNQTAYDLGYQAYKDGHVMHCHYEFMSDGYMWFYMGWDDARYDEILESTEKFNDECG